MCDFWKGTFLEYATALSPYIIAVASFILAKTTGVFKYFRNRNEIIVRNTWQNIINEAKKSLYRPDENGVVHSPSPKTWKEAEKDAIELAKIEYPNEWEQYKKINAK